MMTDANGLSKESLRKIKELASVGVAVDFYDFQEYQYCFLENDVDVIFAGNKSKQFAFLTVYARYLELIIQKGEEVKKLG